MARLNKDGIESLVTAQITDVTSGANTEPTNVFFAGFSGGQLNDGRQSVVPLADLPDPEDPTIPEGQIVYVDTINIPAILNNCCWFALDGRLVAGNLPSTQLWSWGFGSCGRLGDGTILDKCSPVQEISASTTWCQASTGYTHSSAVKTDGTLWSWGSGQCGMLGNNSVNNRTLPVQEITSSTTWCQASAGDRRSSAIKTDGTLWTWGIANYGRLGDNTIVNKSSPVQESRNFVDWCQVSTGSFHASAVRTDGSLWSWGRGTFGRLGNNSTVDRSSPVREISNSTNWCQTSSDATTSALKTDGTLWSWGRQASYGELGDGTTIDRSSPVREISLSTNWCIVANGDTNVSAIKADGTIWGWGRGATGANGDGTTTNRCSPVQETSLSTNWCKVSAGSGFVSAIKTDGTLWSWGLGNCGALGDGTTAPKCSPVQEISSSSNWYELAQLSNSRHNIALKLNTVFFKVT